MFHKTNIYLFKNTSQTFKNIGAVQKQVIKMINGFHKYICGGPKFKNKI